MLRSLAVSIVITCALLAGCSGSPAPEVRASSTPSKSADQQPDLNYTSKWKPLDSGSPGGDVVKPFLVQPNLDQIGYSKGDRSRAGAERFAVLVATTYIDARKNGPDPEEFMRNVTTKDFPAPVRDHLIDDMNLQRRGTLRHFDDRSQGWLRSTVIGDQAAPKRVNIEVAGYVISEPFDVHSWYRTRYDIVWQSGGWAMADFSDGKFGPDDTKVSSASEANKLWGPGWRLIPAAKN